jgi:hypothetical protein
MKKSVFRGVVGAAAMLTITTFWTGRSKFRGLFTTFRAETELGQSGVLSSA